MIDPGEGTVVLVVASDGMTIGLVQSAEERASDHRRAGVDIAPHPNWHGRGLSGDTVRILVRYLVQQRGHRRTTIDPAAHDHHAIRSYGRVGCRPVDVVGQYERGTNGTWHDALLMDLLRDEFT